VLFIRQHPRALRSLKLDAVASSLDLLGVRHTLVALPLVVFDALFRRAGKLSIGVPTVRPEVTFAP
jgi:hypothetical protein